MKHQLRARREGWMLVYDASEKRHAVRFWPYYSDNSGKVFRTHLDAELYVAMRAAERSMLHQRALRLVTWSQGEIKP